jgi:hypothetical protein
MQHGDNSNLWDPDDPKLFVLEWHTIEWHPVAFVAFGFSRLIHEKLIW